MAKLKFSNLTAFNEFLKYQIEYIETFGQDWAIMSELENPYDLAEILEGIDREYGENFTYV